MDTDPSVTAEGSMGMSGKTSSVSKQRQRTRHLGNLEPVREADGQWSERTCACHACALLWGLPRLQGFSGPHMGPGGNFSLRGGEPLQPRLRLTESLGPPRVRKDFPPGLCRVPGPLSGIPAADSALQPAAGRWLLWAVGLPGAGTGGPRRGLWGLAVPHSSSSLRDCTQDGPRGELCAPGAVAGPGSRGLPAGRRRARAPSLRLGWLPWRPAPPRSAAYPDAPGGRGPEVLSTRNPEVPRTRGSHGGVRGRPARLAAAQGERRGPGGGPAVSTSSGEGGRRGRPASRATFHAAALALSPQEEEEGQGEEQDPGPNREQQEAGGGKEARPGQAHARAARL